MPKSPITALVAALAACASANVFAVTLTVNDACGKSMSAVTGASTTVASSGDMTANSVSGGGYTAGVGHCPPAAPDNLPRCSLSVSQSLVALNTQVTLYANCTSNPTAFTWVGPSSPGLPANAPSSKAISLSFPASGVYSYTVRGHNASGAGPASAQVTIHVADATTKPACTLTASPAFVQPNGISTLQVACNPQGTSYAWSADPGAPLPAASESAKAMSFTVPGTFTYKVRGVNGNGHGPVASATVTVEGVCTHAPVQYEFAAPALYTYHEMAMPTHWVVAYSFSLPSGSASFNIQRHADYMTYRFPEASEWSISKCKGDFTVGGACRVSFGAYGSMSAYTAGNPASQCVIEPNTTYYLNFKPTYCQNDYCGWRMYRN